MANGWGGARQGAGRKTLRERYGAKITKAEKLFAEHLEKAAANLKQLADGATRIEEEYAPAGTITKRIAVMDDAGQPKMDPKTGRPILADVDAFPDRPTEELILVKRKVITLGPDREANVYITDRILGKPVAAVEAEVSGPDGGAVPVAYMSALGRVWGDEETDSVSDSVEPAGADTDTDTDTDDNAADTIEGPAGETPETN